MIVDLRLRPPIPGFARSTLYQAGPKTSHPDFPVEPSVGQCSLPLLISEMDAAGVAVGVVPGRYSMEPFGIVSNDELATLFADYPGRFVGFMGLDLGWPMQRMLDEIDARVGTPGFRGVALEPTISADASFCGMNDKRLYPIYEACVKHGVPVSVTLSAVLQAFTKRPYEHSNPVQAYQVAIDFPSLDIVIAHAAYPWVMEMIGVCLTCPNVWLSPDLYLTNVFPGAQEYAKAAATYLPRRTLFGTGYPAKPFKPMIDAYAAWGWPQDVVAAILGGNAARLLRLADQ
ncbi:amidohydrolase [Bordetella parapertussis]|uniref:Amidohydrolase-related domain-containing protein n=2 Tax=Bordetella parapertussis TaxID=519 RepID=Q7W625_BORPA|nr:amidohydrolase family protein [Bordetella parapertussis]AOB40090.1 hypothetical protein BBB43_15650 [Bordetella parapertussis]AUL44106.1 hypothetical protein BTL54_15745 [Bordetella parapertussis]AWP62379.1 hypothetical protein B7P06_06305 [Bordetella parapertussis]AWP69880.1 hypothetical protein B7O99_06300 [Bordetella parapertussis]AWP90119.1 hypothetical protein B7P05_15750 [Bordetella parapertussis]